MNCPNVGNRIFEECHLAIDLNEAKYFIKGIFLIENLVPKYESDYDV